MAALWNLETSVDGTSFQLNEHVSEHSCSSVEPKNITSPEASINGTLSRLEEQSCSKAVSQNITSPEVPTDWTSSQASEDNCSSAEPKNIAPPEVTSDGSKAHMNMAFRKLSSKLRSTGNWTVSTIIEVMNFEHIKKHVDYPWTEKIWKFSDYLKRLLPDIDSTYPSHLFPFYVKATACGNWKNDKIRSWLVTMFPSIQVQFMSGIQRIPQFCQSTYGGSKGYFDCIVCYAQATSQGKTNVQAKVFEGCKQAIENGMTSQHRTAIENLKKKGRKVLNTTNAKQQSNLNSFLGRYPSDLGGKCFHVYHTDIVDAFRGSQTIHRMSEGSVFESRKNDNDEYRCLIHRDCDDFRKLETTAPKNVLQVEKFVCFKSGSSFFGSNYCF